MNTKRITSLLAALGLLASLAACGDPNAGGSSRDTGVDAGGGDTSMGQCVIPGWGGEGSPPPPTTPEDCEDTVVHGPEEPVSSDDDPSGDEVPNPGPSPVEPQPGQENVRAIGWEKAKHSDDGTIVDVIFWSGVEPCYVLDRVEVEYEARKVIITLFQGSTPMEEEVACIDIALKKVTTVELDEPLGDRKIVDGTPN